MNRLDNLFKNNTKNLLSIYFTAGYPNTEDTVPTIKALEKSGAHCIEIGFPFSDPLADGPVIQESSAEAIEKGMDLKTLFKQLENIRNEVQIPLILMGYLNPILQYGEQKFVEDCAKIGIDGLIIPDMPLDYYESQLQPLFTAHNLCNVLLITPQTPEDRIKKIDELSSGFIYMVSSNSITGANKSIDLQKDYFERISKLNLKNPTMVGFGIKDSETFKTACQYSHGAIIGSAFIKHVKEHGASENQIKHFVKSIIQ
ncbi:MAG: tryptophan synthase subunit alpha [Luteibaculaceae bacterium]